MTGSDDPLSVALFSEMFMADQLARNRLSRALPKGMELSHFSVLNHLARSSEEKSPAQLARVFHVTRGAMTNTLNRLEWAGHIHVRPDWDDARRKMISISPSGKRARDAAIAAIAPILAETVREIGSDRVRQTLPVIRELRLRLESDEG
ncbi:MarR family transcriptional regulator [Roseibacterium beibuensis]|uniref:MarR family transcriptional regulator n=1 Tax=[Roseibacterium] beibuensis TaxID=1193142 RepID=A0ABP9LE48_9RHOB|nr:MarR family transcriptional regulator [Roseibacterium beibuensis]MCS6623017.1 MarR family transcriptional regulator [Roseibacterium beibuensis]